MKVKLVSKGYNEESKELVYSIKMKTTHKIIIGDSLEELEKIPSESVDLVFADPPYNMSKKKDWAGNTVNI